jgi:hypothetical protein
MTTAGISTAVIAVTTAVVGTALNWDGRLAAWLRAAAPELCARFGAAEKLPEKDVWPAVFFTDLAGV